MAINHRAIPTTAATAGARSAARPCRSKSRAATTSSAPGRQRPRILEGAGADADWRALLFGKDGKPANPVHVLTRSDARRPPRPAEKRGVRRPALHGETPVRPRGAGGGRRPPPSCPIQTTAAIPPPPWLRLSGGPGCRIGARYLTIWFWARLVRSGRAAPLPAAGFARAAR